MHDVDLLAAQVERTVNESLDKTGRDALRYELGTIVARLSEVHGTSFGYDRPDGSMRADSWSKAFGLMVDAVLNDTERFNVHLGPSTGDVRKLVTRHSSVLDLVAEPVLTHFDLWDGNVLVASEDQHVRVSGIIDGERAFWGDPLAELVSTSLMRDPERDEAFNRGYSESLGRELQFTADVRQRLTLYDLYLTLLMLAEAAPRGYDEPAAQAGQRFLRQRLETTMTTLDRS